MDKIKYAASFRRTADGTSFMVKLTHMEGGPKEGSIVRVARRDGRYKWVKLGGLYSSPTDGVSVHLIEKNARMPSDMDGKAIVSKLRFRNPRRIGSAGYESFRIILKYQRLTVKDYLYLGGRLVDLRWDMNAHRCEIVDSLEAEATGESAPLDESGNEIIESDATEYATDGLIEALKELAEEADKEETPEVAPPAIQEVEFESGKDEILPKTFARILSLATLGQNILLTGPSGSGKTFLAAKVAEKLGREFATISCSAGMSESSLSGWLLPIGESGRFGYVPSPFITMYENGGVFLFDEMDAADSNTLIFINSALANGYMTLPQRFENPTVKRHPNFVAIAAANTLGLGEDNVYVGREQLDGATLDRFRAGIVEVDYSVEVERKIVDPEILTWGREVRRVIKRNSLDRIMSTRVLKDFTAQKQAYGYGRKEWEASYLADWSDDDRSVYNSSIG